MNLLKKDIVSGILIALLFAIISSALQVSKAKGNNESAAPTIDSTHSLLS
jgi:hypothetical protein